MAQPVSFSECSSRSIAEEAYLEAKVKFENGFSKDARKVGIARSSTCLADVQSAITTAMRKHRSAQKESKVRKWLVKLSERIHFYGGVLDVFAQHHPEYVALAWGSIKFLITVGVPHNLSILYPTERMKTAVTDLYAYILRFSIRALDWYNEGMFKHVLHAITRPVELRYSDLLQQISDASGTIYQLAAIGQQAELRDMHVTVQLTNRKVDMTIAMMEQINAAVTLHSNAMIDTNYRLSDLQFHRIAATLEISIPNPKKTYEHHYSLRRQRLRNGAGLSVSNNFWQSPKMRNWSSTQESGLSIISANFQSRFIMRDLCIDIIEQLKEAQVPYLLAMKVPQPDGTAATVSASDLLRYLVKQAITIRKESQSEKSMALSCAMFNDASTEMEWFRLLEAVLADLDGIVYIVVDLELLNKNADDSNDFSWTSAFEYFFASLATRKVSTKIKVLFVSYGAHHFQLSASERAQFVVPAKTEIVTARQRKAGRGPQPQQMCFRLRNLPGSPAKRSARIGLQSSPSASPMR
ncbi:hypothetical protein BKA66DRAFT_444640 [Pyrenochaeta sp. MPI-SDFR-AT-0127]|nr:hypothetical protein BKA66DRAFT_444640 [Pyrenochaeta sp. MPI-SDFR-AT-0127]